MQDGPQQHLKKKVTVLIAIYGGRKKRDVQNYEVKPMILDADFILP